MKNKDLLKCSQCNGTAVDGHSRDQPNVYVCTKCQKAFNRKMKKLRETYRLRGS